MFLCSRKVFESRTLIVLSFRHGWSMDAIVYVLYFIALTKEIADLLSSFRGALVLSFYALVSNLTIISSLIIWLILINACRLCFLMFLCMVEESHLYTLVVRSIETRLFKKFPQYLLHRSVGEIWRHLLCVKTFFYFHYSQKNVSVELCEKETIPFTQLNLRFELICAAAVFFFYML